MTDTVGFPRWTTDVTWSTTGNWTTSYPISNLSALPFAKVARSVNTLPNSTLFRGTFSASRLTEIIVLCRHNLTLDARWRVRLYQNAADTSPIWDSGFVDVWPIVYDEAQVTWDSGNFWDLKYTDADILVWRPSARLAICLLDFSTESRLAPRRKHSICF